MFVDARYEKVRADGRVVSQVVLGVRAPEGLREILGVEVADTESEATYHQLFRSLKARGLRGVELVVSTATRASRPPSVATSRGPPGSAARSITPGTCWGW